MELDFAELLIMRMSVSGSPRPGSVGRRQLMSRSDSENTAQRQQGSVCSAGSGEDCGVVLTASHDVVSHSEILTLVLTASHNVVSHSVILIPVLTAII